MNDKGLVQMLSFLSNQSQIHDGAYLVWMLSFLSNQSQMRKAIQYQATMDLYIYLRSLLQAK